MNTRIAFFIFLILSFTIFPYCIIYLQSDFLSSIIPGWNTNITGIKIVSNLIKFLILSIVTFYYWKLSKIKLEINYKIFLIHLLLTFPAIIATKLYLYDFINMNFKDLEGFTSQIKIVVYIRIFTNILFLLGQILFWIFYVRFLKNN
ncbi:hypothetical protein SAMN05444366_1755 [Flavobacterium saccharophilum]|uniref:DUF4149 domain-containing protein n=1 Tax=Flavobacterium saccharophilum TaxID=29534 RepID=A0A1M7DYE5_9FLAO|nr:hypothetical protein SAMN05444366_1755 [Flavobacterium saccharophilum]